MPTLETPLSFRFKLLRWLVYSIMGLLVAILWTNYAKTERYVAWGPEFRPYASIQSIAEGSAVPPFIKRRLLPDAAGLLTHVVPSSVWAGIGSFVDSIPRLNRRVRVVWGWRNQAVWPLLISATFLIFVSATAYAFAADILIRHYFSLSPAQTIGLSSLFSVALLGGGGDRSYEWAPYDFPMACLFAWTLVGIERNRWWTIITFALAAYCKETAAFLIVLVLAYACLRTERRQRLWQAATFALVFSVIQGYIAIRYTAPPLQDVFWFPGRNAKMLLWHFLFSSWKFAAAAVLALRVARIWHQLPRGLRLSVVLVPCFLGVAFFKGWIEEWRAYTELLLPLGLVLVFCARLDLAALFRRREMLNASTTFAAHPSPNTPEAVTNRS